MIYPKTIRFTTAESTLGTVLVAASEQGVCAILLGDNPASLKRQLRAQFPGARLEGGDRALETALGQVVSEIESPKAGLNLPLNLQGTAFQRRVWEALRGIQLGSTASYGEIARRIGSPQSVRAVARACASNPVAVAIPCHRVVRSNGELSGYRWGPDRKAELLRREAS